MHLQTRQQNVRSEASSDELHLYKGIVRVQDSAHGRKVFTLTRLPSCMTALACLCVCSCTKAAGIHLWQYKSAASAEAGKLLVHE